jgi:alginate O-acetyltransferase complex protein AlgI
LLFNSIGYFLFLPIVFLLYWFVFKRRHRAQNYLILAASYFFYGSWSYKFLGLLILSTVLDYLYGFGVAAAGRKKAKLFLWLSIINNLGILAIFKYYDFFALEFSRGFHQLGIQLNPVFLQIVLPVGISFYTFHGLSYVFDIYRGKQQPVRNIFDYGVFVAFFPLLVAGPIERAHHLLPQIQAPKSFAYRQAVEGCRLILWGLFKKVVIADSVAIVADDIFTGFHHYNGVTLFVGAIAFAFQIYGDFSGYSDIAIGTAKLFGFEVFSNFRFPYFSRNIGEFWRRWHISLTSWFRDYVYIPLGGSRNGRIKTIRNIFIIFLLSGFWHGASWNFIVWGFVHACAFMPLLLLNRNRQYALGVVAEGRHLPTLKEFTAMLFTFGIVTLAWIFFRAPDVGSACEYLAQMVSDIIANPQQLLSVPRGVRIFPYIIPLLLCDWQFRKNERHLLVPANTMVRWSIYTLITFLILMHFGSEKQFIYFQF